MNIKFDHVILAFNDIGYFFGGSINYGSGERISFENSTFTRNKIDIDVSKPCWSQLSFHNCSFDFSDCVIYVPWNAESNYSANSYQISFNQCHIEGIGYQIGNSEAIRAYNKPVGIVYGDTALYSIVISFYQCVYNIDRDYYWYRSLSTTKQNCSRLILSDNYIYCNSTTKQTITSLVKNIRVSYHDIYWRADEGTRMPSKAISSDLLINTNAYMENLTAGTYSKAGGTVIGDFTVGPNVGVSSIVCSNDTSQVSGGKKLSFNFDTTYSGDYASSIQMTGNKYYRCDGNRTIIAQLLSNAYAKDGGRTNLEITVTCYNSDKELIGTHYTDLLFASPSNDVKLPTCLPIVTETGTEYIKLMYKISNGKDSTIKAVRDIGAILVYYID